MTIIKYFEYEHLPDGLQAISKPICEVAQSMDVMLANGPEKSAGMRKLLEAKDCFVRAGLSPVPIHYSSPHPLTLSLSSDTVLFLFKASWPLVAKAIKESLEAVVTEENLIKAQEQLREAVAWMTDKIPGDFDDILVGKS